MVRDDFHRGSKKKFPSPSVLATLAGMNFQTYALALALMGGWAGHGQAVDIAIPKPLRYVPEGVYMRTNSLPGTNVVELSGGRFRLWMFSPAAGRPPRSSTNRSTFGESGSSLASGTYTTNGNVAKLVFSPDGQPGRRTNEWTCVEFEGRVMLYNTDPVPPGRRARGTNFSPSEALTLTDRKLDDIIAGK
jgi:hypothetical protein